MIGPLQRKIGTMEPLQSGRFFRKIQYLPLWPTYIVEKGRRLGKTYGIEVRFYWERLWGTRWEHSGNPLGTMKN